MARKITQCWLVFSFSVRKIRNGLAVGIHWKVCQELQFSTSGLLCAITPLTLLSHVLCLSHATQLVSGIAGDCDFIQEIYCDDRLQQPDCCVRSCYESTRLWGACLVEKATECEVPDEATCNALQDGEEKNPLATTSSTSPSPIPSPMVIAPTIPATLEPTMTNYIGIPLSEEESMRLCGTEFYQLIQCSVTACNLSDVLELPDIFNESCSRQYIEGTKYAYFGLCYGAFILRNLHHSNACFPISGQIGDCDFIHKMHCSDHLLQDGCCLSECYEENLVWSACLVEKASECGVPNQVTCDALNDGREDTPCSLCYGGDTPLFPANGFSGPDTQPCDEADRALQANFNVTDDFCLSANAQAHWTCGCPRLPPYRDSPLCSLCPNGSPPPNSAVVLDYGPAYPPFENLTCQAQATLLSYQKPTRSFVPFQSCVGFQDGFSGICGCDDSEQGTESAATSTPTDP